jgi:hypothetical protein
MGFCKDPQVSKENRVLVGVKRIRVPFRIPHMGQCGLAGRRKPLSLIKDIVHLTPVPLDSFVGENILMCPLIT